MMQIEGIESNATLLDASNGLQLSINNRWLPVFNNVEAIIYADVDSTQALTLTFTNTTGKDLSFQANSSSLSFNFSAFMPSKAISKLILMPIDKSSVIWKQTLEAGKVQLLPQSDFILSNGSYLSFKLSNISFSINHSISSSLGLHYAQITGVDDGSMTTPVYVVIHPSRLSSKNNLLLLPLPTLDNGGVPNVIYLKDFSKNQITLTIPNTTSKPLSFITSSNLSFYFSILIDKTNLAQLVFTDKDDSSRWNQSLSGDQVILTATKSFSINIGKSLVFSIDKIEGKPPAKQKAAPLKITFNGVDSIQDDTSVNTAKVSLRDPSSPDQDFPVSFSLPNIYPYPQTPTDAGTVFMSIKDKFSVENKISLSLTGPENSIKSVPGTSKITVKLKAGGEQALTTVELMKKIHCHVNDDINSEWSILAPYEDNPGEFTIIPKGVSVFNKGIQIVTFEFTNILLDSSTIDLGSTVINIVWKGFASYKDGSTTLTISKKIPAPGLWWFLAPLSQSFLMEGSTIDFEWNAYGANSSQDNNWYLGETPNSFSFSNLKWKGDKTIKLPLQSTKKAIFYYFGYFGEQEHPLFSTTYNIVTSIPVDNHQVISLALNNRYLYVGLDSNIISTIDIVTHTHENLTSLGLPVSFVFSPDRRTIGMVGAMKDPSDVNTFVFVILVYEIDNPTKKHAILMAKMDAVLSLDLPCDILAFSNDSKYLYLFNSRPTAEVNIMDMSKDKPVLQASIKLGANYISNALTLSKDGGTLYVAIAGIDGAHVVSVCSLSAKSKVKDIDIGGRPITMALKPGSDLLYVAKNDSIAIIDTSSNTCKPQQIPLEEAPNSFVFSPNGEYLYVLSSKVFVIDTTRNAIISIISVGEIPRAVAISSDGKTLYVGCKKMIDVIPVGEIFK